MTGISSKWFLTWLALLLLLCIIMIGWVHQSARLVSVLVPSSVLLPVCYSNFVVLKLWLLYFCLWHVGTFSVAWSGSVWKCELFVIVLSPAGNAVLVHCSHLLFPVSHTRLLVCLSKNYRAWIYHTNLAKHLTRDLRIVFYFCSRLAYCWRSLTPLPSLFPLTNLAEWL